MIMTVVTAMVLLMVALMAALMAALKPVQTVNLIGQLTELNAVILPGMILV